jgi:N-acetylglucosaminyldiphosphoundecaprenol N-acetyl-beta-D-mannosaminyltransferase
MMTNNQPYRTYKILGITIHSLTIENLKLFLSDLLTENNTPKLLTTFNLDFLKIANKDKEFNNICKQTLLNLPDGFGITSLIKRKYKEKIPRITGNDVFPVLIDLALKSDKRIAIIGGTNEVSRKTETILINQYGISQQNLFCYSPSYQFEKDEIENKEVIEKITDFKPDIVFAALGCPRQEKWLYKNMNSFGSKINIGIGATLDFFTGTKKRSPALLQSMGLEWLWRLFNEPTRLFKRYIVNDLPFYIKTYFSKNI